MQEGRVYLKTILSFKRLEKANNECFLKYTKYNALTQFLNMAEDSISKELSDRKLI